MTLIALTASEIQNMAEVIRKLDPALGWVVRINKYKPRARKPDERKRK